MTTDVLILQKVDTLTRRVGSLERLFRKKAAEEEWLTELQVSRIYGYGPKTMQRFRKSGALKARDYKSIQGRRFRYRREALENLYQ